jgi:hypothetical protein
MKYLWFNDVMTVMAWEDWQSTHQQEMPTEPAAKRLSKHQALLRHKNATTNQEQFGGGSSVSSFQIYMACGFITKTMMQQLPPPSWPNHSVAD